MPKKLSWSAFVDRFPAAHLVAGEVPQGEGGDIDPRQRLQLVSRLLARLDLEGFYALAINRENGAPDIHCVFERAADADRAADALQAAPVDRYPGWTRQRSFVLDEAAMQTIEAFLGGRAVGHPGRREAERA